MLYIIGTGLNDYKDISLRGLEILKDADAIYQECYTCIQNRDFSEIEKYIGKKIVMADRKMVEETCEFLEEAKTKKVAFLVAGTPFFATTHSDLYIRALSLQIEVRVLHNTSILNVKGCYGLYSYNFGMTISIPYFTESYKPMSFYDNIHKNYSQKMHTLCLLDIKTDENRFMTANEAIAQLLECEADRKYGM
ncbi:diphthine methyl ester synthase, partial [Enteropsectra breve]